MLWALSFILLAPDAGLADAGAPDAYEAVPEPVIEPAQATTQVAAEFPDTAKSDMGRAVLELELDATGTVTTVRAIEATEPVFEAALRAVVPQWRFTPATADGTPIPSVVRLAWDFERPIVLGTLRGQIFKRGVKRPMAGIVLVFRPAVGEAIEVVSNAEGRFEIEAPVGEYSVSVTESGFTPFRTQVTLSQGTFSVEWRITPRGPGRRGFGRRWTTGRGQHRQDDPGPLRAAACGGHHGRPAPGDSVAARSRLAVLAVPLPRRARRPARRHRLLHRRHPDPAAVSFGVGTSVVHPRTVERVDFYPGAAPVQFGRYVGGAVNAVTQPPPGDGWLTDIDVNLFQSGVLVSAPISEDTRLTVGGRYSYTGLILSLVAEDVQLDFWDYSLRLDHEFTPGKRLKINVFGAQDEFGEKSKPEENTFTSFHRIATRYRHAVDDEVFTLGLDLGLDRLDLPQDDVLDERAILREFVIRPLAIWQHTFSEDLRLRFGADLEVRPADNDLGNLVQDAQSFISAPQTKYALGSYLAMDINFTDVEFVPSVRLDGYTSSPDLAIDPRFGARWRVGETTTLKGHVGIAHAPQRFVIPIPGIGDAELDAPLQRAWQTAVGVEQSLGDGYSLDTVVYGNYRQQVLSSFTTDNDEDDVTDDSFEVSTHDERAYGVEIMLRRRRERGFFGWIAYTLQRAEREDETGAFVVSALDQTHILNVVGSYRAGNWVFGARLHYHSGRMVEDDFGDRDRLPGFLQLDLRIDKFWIGDTYQIDAYIDVINSTFAGEVTSNDPLDDPIEYILPTIGLHAVF